MTDGPLISVVIPSWNRSTLARRAVASALAQTEPRIEVIVVVDDSDGTTAEAIATVGDPRVRTVELASRVGGSAARNRGVTEAAGRWVALLDDDDEWLPDKLRTQLAIAEASSWQMPIVSSRLIARTVDADLLLPRRLPVPGEPLSEYLSVRHFAFRGEGFLSTSTLMAPTELFRRVPFPPELRHMQDVDWVLRAVLRPDVGVECAPEALAIRHDDFDRPRISTELEWRPTFDWVTANRSLFTPRAYAAILMGLVSSLAAPGRDARVFRILLRESMRNGRPTALELATFGQVWLIPRSVRLTIRDRLAEHLLRYQA